VETGATGDLVRHRLTKGAATDRVDLKSPASHSDSTDLSRSLGVEGARWVSTDPRMASPGGLRTFADSRRKPRDCNDRPLAQLLYERRRLAGAEKLGVWRKSPRSQLETRNPVQLNQWVTTTSGLQVNYCERYVSMSLRLHPVEALYHPCRLRGSSLWVDCGRSGGLVENGSGGWALHSLESALSRALGRLEPFSRARLAVANGWRAVLGLDTWMGGAPLTAIWHSVDCWRMLMVPPFAAVERNRVTERLTAVTHLARIEIIP
jgi:hypothetical protein